MRIVSRETHLRATAADLREGEPAMSARSSLGTQMTSSQPVRLRTLERSTAVFRNLMYHRTLVLEPIRRIALRNMRHLSRIMTEHPKPATADEASTEATAWIERVRDQMLKDQGLEASALNRLLVQRATFTPVKLHAALLYAELDYMRKHRQDYPLQTSRALSTLLRHRSDFLERSKEFRHGILHPSDQSVPSETVWVESGFSNELPIVQREVDAILGDMEQTLRSDVEQRLLGLPELLRWHCNARFLHWVCDDDAVLLNDERFKELTEALGRLDDEYERIGRDSQPPEFSPSVIGQGNRLVRCMTNLHHQFVALSPSDEGHIQPGFRPTFLKRFEPRGWPAGRHRHSRQTPR